MIYISAMYETPLDFIGYNQMMVLITFKGNLSRYFQLIFNENIDIIWWLLWETSQGWIKKKNPFDEPSITAE